MLHRILVTEHVVYDLKVETAGAVALLSEDTLDTLVVFLRQSERPGIVVVNDKIADHWGEEVHVMLPPADSENSDRIWFKFNGKLIEIWSQVEAKTFPRFDAERGAAARLMHLFHAENPGGGLVSGMPTLESTLAKIEHHILTRRLDALEARLGTGQD